MNQRDAFKIPLGEPTNDQLIEINERLEILRNKKSNRINIGNAFIPSSIEHSNYIYDFSIGREHCRYASQFLNNSKRELVFALTDFAQPNGYALPCGEFDAVLLTTGFFIELNKIISLVFDIFFRGDMTKITGKKNFKHDFLSNFKENQTNRNDELVYFVRNLAISHIIGHEFGHLASGHIGFANNTEKYENNNGSLASSFFNSKSNSLISQAREVEADVFAAVWVDCLLNNPVSSSHTEILIWLKNNPCRLSFVFTLSSLLWYVTLGAKKFSAKKFILLTTHPPTGLRAKTITDSALVRSFQKDLKNRRRHENFALEAFFLIGLGEVLKRMYCLNDKFDEDSKKMLENLNGLSKKDKINKCLGEMGLSISKNKYQAIITKEYLTKMWQISIANKKYTEPLSRWKPEARVKWGFDIPQSYHL